MSCPLCRVSKTDEHLSSGWHKFNERLFSQGKMPIAEENYTKYEKPKEDAILAAGGDPAAALSAGIVAPEANTHNVNKWHWEESDYTSYARKRITKLLKALEIPVEGGVSKITETKFTGDAYIHNRKGRVFCGFEFRIDIDYKVTLGEDELTGKAILPDVGADDDDIEITAVKTEGGSDTQRSAVNSAMRKGGVKLIASAVNEFKKELQKIAQDPSGFDPHSDDEDAGAAGSDSD